jgi:hypothetical protein
MKTIIDKEKDRMIIKYHVLCRKLELRPDEKAAMLESYGCESSKDLSINDLIDVIGKLELQLNPELLKLDTWRKRVIASIDGYLVKINYGKANINLIKSIAVRAAEAKTFNEIPLARLMNIYYAFVNKQKDTANVDLITSELVDIQTYLN